ncbi:MAG: tetratricopeptide repeat protein [Chitinispirillaceae bacterium]|nr:tetratricopeptide repeat protein [Chitinispirillaceae bacterium]
MNGKRSSIRLRAIAALSFSAVFSLLQLSCVSDSRSIEKGEASLRLGDHTMAIRFFDEVLSRNPENFEARLGMGRALIQQASLNNADGTLWGKALTHLEAARTIRPESDIDTLLSEAWLVNARRLLNRSDTINALNALSRAIDLHPRGVEALNLAGIIYFRMGESDKARILFERALVADTSRPFTHFNIGMVRWALNDIRGAHDAWFRALRLAPDDKDIVYWYAAAEKKLREAAP